MQAECRGGLGRLLGDQEKDFLETNTVLAQRSELPYREKLLLVAPHQRGELLRRVGGISVGD